MSTSARPGAAPARLPEGDGMNGPGTTAHACAPPPAPSGRPEPAAATSITSEFKGVAKHSLIVGAGLMLGKLLGFLLIPIYTRHLTPAEYGIAQLLDLTTSLIGMMLNLAVTAPILRFYHDAPDEPGRRAVISTALVTIVGLNLVSVPFLVISAPLWSTILFGTSEYATLFTLSFINLFCGTAREVPIALLRARQRSTVFIGVSLTGAVITLLLNVFFIVYLGWGLFGLVMSSLLAQALLALVLSLWTVRQVGIRFCRETLRKMVAYGFPYVPQSLGLFSLHFADMYFLKHYASLTDVGIYGLAYKFGFVAYVFVHSPYWIVWGAKRFELANHPAARKIYARNLTYISTAYLFVGLLVALLIGDTLAIIATPAYWPAARLVPLIVLAYLFAVGYYSLQIGICLERKTQYLAYVVGAAAALNLLLNLALIPRYLGLGAAVATCMSFASLAAGTYVISQRVYPIAYEFRRLGIVLGLAVGLYGISTLVGGNGGIVGLLMKTALGGAFPVLLYSAGFFDREERRQIAKLLAPLTNRLRRSTVPA